MRYERLLLENDGAVEPASFDFHPALTVITDLGPDGREVLLQQLIASVSGGMKGAHAEIRTDQGRKLTIVRSAKIPDMVIDSDHTEEVTEHFTSADGTVDIFGAWGIDAAMARLDMEAVHNNRLTHRGADDRDLDRLARLDQELLWELVNEVARSRAEAENAETEFLEMLAQQEAESADEGRDGRELALDALQSSVFESEQGTGRYRTPAAITAIVLFAAAVGFLQLKPSTIGVALVAAAAIPLLWGLLHFGRELNAKRALRAAESETGMSLFESQVARVDSILSSGARRRAVRESQHALANAEAAWVEFTGDAELGWVIRHKRLIQNAAAKHRTAGLDPSVATEAFGALITRMVFEEAEEPKTAERLPLVFAEPFAEMSGPEMEASLQLLATSVHARQRIVLTDEPVAVEVAQRGAEEQYVGLISGVAVPVPA